MRVFFIKINLLPIMMVPLNLYVRRICIRKNIFNRKLDTLLLFLHYCYIDIFYSFDNTPDC